MFKFLTALAPDIVSRLRLVFATMAVLVFAVSIIGVRQLTTLKASIQTLTVSSVEVFVEVELAERGLKNLIVILQQVNRAGTKEELQQLGAELDETLSLLRVQISKLGALQQTVAMPDAMPGSLEQIEAASKRILQQNIAVLESEDALNEMEAALFAARDDILGVLEDELFRVKVIGVGDAATNGISSEDAFYDLAQKYSQQLLRANAISTMTLELDAIVNRVSRLDYIQDINDIGPIAADVGLKLRTVTGLLPQIQTESSRVTLALRVIEVRDLIFGTSGVINTVENLVERQAELERIVSDQLVETETISLLSNSLIADAREAINRSNIYVDRNISRMIWLLSFSVLFLLSVIAVTIVEVIERQINSRMSRLTHAVLALAGGARNVNVGVHGTDELGKMALALEVFKSNAAELVRSNKELEKFAYIAAHDLRSPLRAIQDLAAWINEDEDNVMSEDSTEMMVLLSARVERLNRLLSDLLTYSRVGHEGDALAQVSVSGIVEELSDMLDPHKTFEIEFTGTFDTVTTFATPLSQILQNLLTNALKHHDRDTGRILVSTRLQNDRLQVRVEDDGPGIDLKYQEKIFQLFQTLRPRDEVEGSGLGLAIIQKLVHFYGGEITVSSNPASGRGAAFIFDLPASVGQSDPINIAA